MLVRKHRPIKVDNPKDFWARIDSSCGDDACWPWRGPRCQKGYGRWRGYLAHRVAYFLAHGSLPAQPLIIRHRCDSPPCCNPAHLLPGTHKQNKADQIERGRFHPYNAKITLDDAIAIRAAIASGSRKLPLCRRYGLSHNAIEAVISGATWKVVA